MFMSLTRVLSTHVSNMCELPKYDDTGDDNFAFADNNETYTVICRRHGTTTSATWKYCSISIEVKRRYLTVHSYPIVTKVFLKVQCSSAVVGSSREPVSFAGVSTI